MTKFKFEILAGTLSGIIIIVAIWYSKYLGLVSVGYFVPCDSKDILLMGCSVAFIFYKKIFFPRKTNERNNQDE